MDQTFLYFGVFFLLLILVVVLLYGFPSVKKISLGNPQTDLWVEVANTPVKKTIGLMFRTNFQNRGMMFSFSDEKPRLFWMQFTFIPLEAIHIGSNGSVVDIIPMEPCTSLRCRTYPSSKPAKYVLEVPKGFSQKHGVSIGQKINLD